jgi:PRTRC genetic system protein B
MKVDLEIESDNYSLKSALLVYKAGSGKSFVTKHPVSVDPDNGKPIIRAGTTFKDKDYIELVKGLQGRDKPRMVWESERILSRSSSRVIWWSPPVRRPMFFKQSHVKGTFDGHAVCPCPGLIFMASPNDLRIFAIKGTTRPTPETELYQAPFFNVWARAQVCMGTAIAPDETQKQNIDSWEETFFGSNFTHPNIREKDRLTRRIDVCKFWKRMVARPPKNFNENVLVSLNLKAQTLLDLDIMSKLNALRARGEF